MQYIQYWLQIHNMDIKAFLMEKKMTRNPGCYLPIRGAEEDSDLGQKQRLVVFYFLGKKKMACQKLLFLGDRNVGIYFIISISPHLKLFLIIKKMNKQRRHSWYPQGAMQ